MAREKKLSLILFRLSALFRFSSDESSPGSHYIYCPFPLIHIASVCPELSITQLQHQTPVCFIFFKSASITADLSVIYTLMSNVYKWAHQ